MSQLNDPEQQDSFGCGQNGCGNHGSLCPTCDKSFMDSTKMKCPDRNPRCSDKNQCDFCQATKHSLVENMGGAVGGGKARDVAPLQAVHGSSDQKKCDECNQPLGSNTRECGFCASVAELPTNSAQPKINYHDDFGPEKGSFGPCTDATTEMTLKNFQKSFEDSKRNGFPFTGITGFKRRASLLRMLLSLGVILGIEGFNNSCFWVVVFWMLSQGNMHERINTDCLSGHILYKILWDLRCGLFVGRDIVEAFRLSLREYPSVQRNMSENGMDDPNCVLVILEDLGILRKGPILSETGCSFHIHEVRGENPASSIQEALCASVSSPSPVPEVGSIISFQFCQQRGNGRFTAQTLGTDFKFPHDGVILNGKLLRPKMFIIYNSKHYRVVLCVGEAFFLSNSLSASQCGHFLPEKREIFEKEAMELFRTQAHTIVFECVGNYLPPPIQPPSVSDTWFPPPPPPAPCAQVALIPSPPQPQCAQVAWVPSPPPRSASCVKVSPYPKQNSPLTQSDITVSGEKWSCNGRAFSGKVENMPHPKFPQVMMEVYFYENVSKTTLKDLVDFLNFIESIQ